MTDLTDLRQGVTPAIHRVLDCLEDIAEGPLGRVAADVLVAEIELIGSTVFAVAYQECRADESDAAVAARQRAQAIAAMRHPQALRMAALLLLAIERCAADVALADVLPPKVAA